METPLTRSVTKTVTIDRPAADVYAFLDFLMTVAQLPGLDDAIFEALLSAVDTELATLKKLLESPTYS